jgi:hypothetical protein
MASIELKLRAAERKYGKGMTAKIETQRKKARLN